MDRVRITYYGHACFGLSYQDWEILLDPYADGSVPGLRPVRAAVQAVYCSHEHDDHSNRAAAQLVSGRGEPPYTLQCLDVPHDDREGELRGRCRVHIFTFGSLRVAHLGDLGRALTAQECAALDSVDALLVPVGGVYTIDPWQAKAAAVRTRARVVIPMHYRTAKSGYEELAALEDFTGLFEHTQTAAGDTLLLDEHTPKQILTLVARNEGE